MKKFLTIISVIVLAFGAITIATASTSEDEKANAYIECSTPDFVLGTMSLENFGRIYDMLPSSFQEAMVSYFQDVTDEAEGKSRFSYNGVLVKHPDETTWEFDFQGCSIKVHNASLQMLEDVFCANSSSM